MSYEDGFITSGHITQVAELYRKEDAEFVAKARQDIPRLLDEVKALQAEILQLKGCEE